jgi:hypothetical protein
MVNRILSLFLLLILLTSCSSNEKKYDYEEERSYKEYVDISSQKENQQRPQSTQQQTTQNSQSTTMQTSQQQKSETETTKSEDYDPEADYEFDRETGGTTVDVVDSEFELAKGAADAPEGTPTGKDGETAHGPWDTRLVLATSEDSVNWEKTELVLADQADVPSLVYDSEGTLFLYYVTWAGKISNRIVVAVSEDDGESWSFKKVDLPSEKGWSAIVDPAVVLLDDGTLRMYATLDEGDGEGPATHSFISKDGITFEIEDGVRFDSENYVLDPNVLLIGDTWHYFAGGEGAKNYHATSSDGLDFEEEEKISLDNLMFSNGIAVEGGARYYAFEFSVDDAIYSLFSEDGSEWEVEGVVLELEESDVETRAVKDASVIQLKDESYLMVYTTGIVE